MVVRQRNHAAHAVVDVVAVQTDEQHNNRWNSGPENLEREIALDGDAITKLAAAPSESDQAEHQQANDANEQNDADCEQNLKKFVVDRCIHAGINRQKIDVLPDPEPPENEEHSDHESENGRRDLQGSRP